MTISLHLEKTTPKPVPAQTDPADYFNVPLGLKLQGGTLFVADACRARVVKLNAATMAYVDEIVPRKGGAVQEFLLLRPAFDENGALWISDGENSRILKLDDHGEIVKEIGSLGSGPGQFHVPNGMAFAGGFIYVADEFNNRIQKLDLDGGYVDAIDTTVAGVSSFPQDVTVKNGFLYATLTWNNRVAKYNLATLALVQEFILPAAGSFPRGVDVADDGSVAVADTGHNRTIVFNADGTTRAIIANTINPLNTPESMNAPVGVQWAADGTLFQVQSLVHVVHRYSPQPGNTYKLNGYGGHVRNLPFQMSFAFGLSRDAAPGKTALAVADCYNHRVQVYDNAGMHVRTVDRALGANYNFVLPSDVLYGSDGKIYVCDFQETLLNGRIKVFDGDWNYVKTIQFTAATLPASFGYFFPIRLAMNADGHLFCSDYFFDAIHKIDPNTGHVLTSYVRFGSGGLKRGLTIHPSGDLYVADRGLSQIFQFSADLAVKDIFGEIGTGESGLFSPLDLSFDQAGKLLFVADSGNFRLKLYQDKGFLQNLGSIGITAAHFFGLVAAKARDVSKLATGSGYCNQVCDYTYNPGGAAAPGKGRSLKPQDAAQRAKLRQDAHLALKQALDDNDGESAKRLIAEATTLEAMSGV